MKPKNEDELINKSYGYWEWHKKFSYIECNKQGKSFTNFSSFVMLFGFFFCFATVFFFYTYVRFLLSIPFDDKGLINGIIGGITVVMWILLPLLLHYLLFPQIGKSAFKKGYINEEELSIINIRRIPKSFIPPKFLPLESDCCTSTDVPPSETTSQTCSCPTPCGCPTPVLPPQNMESNPQTDKN
jgi:hypothetical protein